MRALLATLAIAACSSHGPGSAQPKPPPDAATAEIAPPIDRGPKDPAAPTLRLPTSFAPTAYRAALVIDPAQPSFTGTIAIDATLASPSSVIWLDAEQLTIDHADASGTELAATEVGPHFVALRAAKPIAAGALTLHVTYHGAISDHDDAGAWRRQWNGAWYAFTAFAPVAARRVFPCVDEPTVKVPWQLTIEIPRGDVALSNTAAKVTATQSGARYEFATTRPLPSYLIAFAVGPYELVDGGKTPSGKPIRIAAPAGRAKEAAYAATTTTKIVSALEDWFGTALPYDKLDLVAVGAEAGGVESPAMITAPLTDLLIPPDDPSMGRRHAFVWLAAHELAHHWFGDLVTTAWWDDIWLNEAFATWMTPRIVAAIEPSAHIELAEVATLGRALDGDDVASARMIRQPIASEDDVYDAFDGITSNKGASVIRMFERWAGPAKFQAGVRAYLKAHADGVATADDFLDAIDAATGKDVRTPFQTFLDQPGAPRITAKISCDGANAKIALHQERYLPRGAPPAADTTWQVPVCVVHGNDRVKVSRQCTLLTRSEGTLKLAGGCPTWLYANAGASGYYRVGLDASALDAIAQKGWRELDDAEKLAVAFDALAGVRHGDLDADAMLALVPRLLDEKPGAMIEVAVQLGARVEDFVAPAQRAGYEAWIRKTYGPLAAKLGWRAHKGDSLDVERARAAIVPFVADDGDDPSLRADAVKLAATWQELPAATRAGALSAAVQDGATFDALIAQLPGVTDRIAHQDLLIALAHTRDPDRLARVLALVIDPSLPWDETAWLALEPDDAASESIAASFVRDHLAEIAARMPEPVRAGLARAAAVDCDPATRDAVVQATATLRRNTGAPRRIAQAIDRLDVCIAQKQLQSAALTKLFGGTK